ncbi:hypothetical protein GCM10017559_82880 [Streptosporangium longisporum]|uniref:Uncharacterized protein n=1 Tax=Streptosporangium longisporum TaxID=46187 RepID=A0ABP6LJR2_9ACTN
MLDCERGLVASSRRSGNVHELERTLDLIWIEEPRPALGRRGLAVVGRGIRRLGRTPGRTSPGWSSTVRAGKRRAPSDIVQTAAVWGSTHFLRVSALAHAHDLPVKPTSATSQFRGRLLCTPRRRCPNHMVSELQDLRPPVGVSPT